MSRSIVLLLAAVACSERGHAPQAKRAAIASTPTIVAVAAGGDHTCAIDSAGVGYCWGRPVGQRRVEPYADSLSRPLPREIPGGARWLALSVAPGAACGVTRERDVYCWGDNQFGRLGVTPDTLRHDELVRVEGTPPAAALVTGMEHACAIALADSTLLCWGYNFDGQVGDGTGGRRRYAPVPVR